MDISEKESRKIIESDHNPLILNINLKCINSTSGEERIEFYNYKDDEGLGKFYDLTSEYNTLSKCFEDNNEFLTQAQKWFKTLNSHIKRSFKKVRLSNKLKPNKSSKLQWPNH